MLHDLDKLLLHLVYELIIIYIFYYIYLLLGSAAETSTFY